MDICLRINHALLYKFSKKKFLTKMKKPIKKINNNILLIAFILIIHANT